MLFNRNKNRNKMIDVRQLEKRGVVKLPKKEITVPTTKEGFVEFNKPKSNADFFGFTNTPPHDSQLTTHDSSDNYNKREVDTKMANLDNKIYKLEQRIELLEKKLDINQSNNSNPIGW
ncbi:hypothetical protein J4226_02405 [Candidatus Pacearchaeota archaeon]|nr:hypothetical protein [Candidatus Pacearchaeota archaeon]